MNSSFFSLVAAHDPLDHALPQRLHDTPLFTIAIGNSDTEIDFLNIHHGKYEFFINNHMMMTLFGAIAVLVAILYAGRRIRPSGKGIGAFQTDGRFAQAIETLCEFIRDSVVRPNLGSHTDKYIGYVWSIFFFVLFCNVLGLIPFGAMAQLISGDFSGSTLIKNWGGTATSNLALNLILAVTSFVAVLFIGIREAGLKNFLSHFNPLGWENKKMLPVGIGLYVLEWLGLIIKCAVLALRLFGTMMAGHLVIAAFIAMIFSAAEFSQWLGFAVGIVVTIGCVLLMILETFIACLQAYIFTFLTVLFISMTIGHHEHEHGDEAAHDNSSHGAIAGAH